VVQRFGDGDTQAILERMQRRMHNRLAMPERAMAGHRIPKRMELPL
jgi:hypothetical protein